MSEVKEQIVLNENGTADWNLQKMARDGNMYTGPFRFKTSMDPLSLLAADRDYRKLMGEHAAMADDMMHNMAFALAQLKQRVISSPPFWNDGSTDFGGGRTQYEVLQTVLDAAIAAQEKNEERLRDRSSQMAENIRKTLEGYSKEQKTKVDEEEEGLDGAGEE